MPSKHKICEHGKIKIRCRDCGGSQFCPHNKALGSCIACGGPQICKHRRRKYYCSLCQPEGSYNYYRSNAKKRNRMSYNFMSFEEYFTLIKKNCFWCGRSPNQANGMGVDRVDNYKGYEMDNILPACGDCNMRRGRMDFEEFRKWCETITEYNIKKRKSFHGDDNH